VSELLQDLLESGVYGDASLTRKRSSTITLNAVTEGTGKHPNMLKTIFPNRDYLKQRYPFVEKYPFLLPIAWIGRLLSYQKEQNSVQEAGKSIEIGKRRIHLLQQYGIIPEESKKEK
jgi:hypothetical protein